MGETEDTLYNDKLAPIVAHWWHTRGRMWATEHKVDLSKYSPPFAAFTNLIGDPVNENRRYVVDVTKQRVRNLIDSLDSPHQATLLKMLELRYEETHNPHSQ